MADIGCLFLKKNKIAALFNLNAPSSGDPSSKLVKNQRAISDRIKTKKLTTTTTPTANKKPSGSTGSLDSRARIDTRDFARSTSTDLPNSRIVALKFSTKIKWI